MPIYRKVTVSYWDGELAEANRGDVDAHVVAFYLMTCPATNQLGVYRLAIPTLCDHVGIDSRRASEALAKLSERGFSVYDERFRMIFVVEYARHEYGEVPNLADNRVKSLRTALPDLLAICRKSNVWQHFWARYGKPWAEVLAGCEPPESEGLPKGFRRASGRLQDQDQDQDQDQESGDPSDLVGVAGAPADDVGQNGQPTKKTAEIAWRIDQVWEAHLAMRERYWQKKEYAEKPPGPPPALTKPRRKLIGDALKRLDGHLLRAEHREDWLRHSAVRAAAIGIFLDPWCTASAEGNRLEEGGKRYLEPERPFRVKNGIDQAEKFAQLYFEARERKERQHVPA